jgi:hypothetical protein
MVNTVVFLYEDRRDSDAWHQPCGGVSARRLDQCIRQWRGATCDVVGGAIGNFALGFCVITASFWN